MSRATIAALATGRPPSAVAIIRISGGLAWSSVAALLTEPLPAPRLMSLRQLRDPRFHHDLDQALVVVFAASSSSTGEDVAELHLHGGVAVIGDVLDALTALPGVRLAEAGEFTRRAFENGKLDLAQVEGLADLISAETSVQRQQALALAGGALGRLAEQWREQLIGVLAQAEAALDFAEDEADVAERLVESTTATLRELAVELAELIADAKRAVRIREGLTIVVVGPPNVGKSSLVNALTLREAAIVTPFAGTTRDPIEVALDLGGVAASLIDTAGIRETDDLVEVEGIKRTRARAAAADLVLLVVEPDTETPPRSIGQWIICNKIDLAGGARLSECDFSVSARTGVGVGTLLAALESWAATIARPGQPALLARIRHHVAFGDAATAILEAADTSDALLRAEGLRRAVHALGTVTGSVGVDEVLDRIFSQFCIGK